jgi:PTH1 family peptidyl-tRNA hydrolase
LVLGLGNPGGDYRATRHNLGFRVLDRLASRAGVLLAAAGDLRSTAWWAEVRIAGRPVVLAKPRTYMNRSGRAAAALCRTLGVGVADLVVVHDDADLALGRLRVRRGGATGGHNGLRSILDVLGDADFVRVRLGVRGIERDREDLAEYVLRPFDADEEPVAEALADAAADAVEHLVAHGLDDTMNRFNGRDVAGTARSEDRT